MSKNSTNSPEGWDTHGRFKIGFSTLIAICRYYQVDYRLMKKKLEKIEKKLGDKDGYYYNPRQVAMILQHLGLPVSWEKKPGSNNNK